MRSFGWIEWTCCECNNTFTEQTGDVDERLCDECLVYEHDFNPEFECSSIVFDKKGKPVYSRYLTITGAFERYFMESRIYRFLKRIGLR